MIPVAKYLPLAKRRRTTRRTGHLTKGHGVQLAASIAAASLSIGLLVAVGCVAWKGWAK